MVGVYFSATEVVLLDNEVKMSFFLLLVGIVL